MRTRDWIMVFVGVLAALVVATIVIDRTNAVQAHLCESNQKVRQPFVAYIDSTVPLYMTSMRLQAAEARLQPQPAPQLAALQRQLSALQAENFNDLKRLRAALTASVVSGCKA